jgi:hypothetical protein
MRPIVAEAWSRGNFAEKLASFVPLRFHSSQSVDLGSVATFLQRAQQPLHLP